MAMRSNSNRRANNLWPGAPHFMMLGGITKIEHIDLLAQAITGSSFHFDAEEFASKLIRDRSEMMRRVVYQAVMYVSANCSYNAPVRRVQSDGSTKIVNEECHLTYSQALQALITNDAGAFRGNLTDDKSAEERSMAHKWELFRQGYYVYRDSLTRRRYEIEYNKSFNCMCKSDKQCGRFCPEALFKPVYEHDIRKGQANAILDARQRGVEIRMK